MKSQEIPFSLAVDSLAPRIARGEPAGVGSASLPGTCGELFQGVLDGEPCLVSCPIDAYAHAKVRYEPEAPTWVGPANRPKAWAAAQAGARHLGLSRGGTLRIASALPLSRGYGSSTADVGAALFATAHAVGRTLDHVVAARLAAQIEPSDSTLFPGLALFAHRDGASLAALGPAPPLGVIVLDPGGEVDTLAYNREVDPQTLQRFAAEHRRAFTMLSCGLAQHDWALVGQAATLSAQTHQTVLFNPCLEAALAACRALGGLGVCRAHSGTVLGILLDPVRIDPLEAMRVVRAHVPARVELRLHTLIDGGARRTGHAA